jgi:hypothetical protein
MTSFRQIEANRRNALRSTGPRTEEGKQQSRRNALRHGLTAETVIEGLEDSEDYRAFEAAVIADYDAQTAVERELVLRLASLLWRLRWIISIETDLLRIQSDIVHERRAATGVPLFEREGAPDLKSGSLPFIFDRPQDETSDVEDDTSRYSAFPISIRDLTRCFLRLTMLTTAPLSGSGVTTPHCGNRPRRRCSCSRRSVGRCFRRNAVDRVPNPGRCGKGMRRWTRSSRKARAAAFGRPSPAVRPAAGTRAARQRRICRPAVPESSPRPPPTRQRGGMVGEEQGRSHRGRSGVMATNPARRPESGTS